MAPRESIAGRASTGAGGRRTRNDGSAGRRTGDVDSAGGKRTRHRCTRKVDERQSQSPTTATTTKTGISHSRRFRTSHVHHCPASAKERSPTSFSPVRHCRAMSSTDRTTVFSSRLTGFPDPYTLAYTLTLPAAPSATLPLLIFSHRAPALSCPVHFKLITSSSLQQHSHLLEPAARRPAPRAVPETHPRRARLWPLRNPRPALVL